MLEWTQLSRSLRLIASGRELDVWPIITPDGKRFRFTVMDHAGVYVGEGQELTQDLACEAAIDAALI